MSLLMCMHAQEVLFFQKTYKKACNILKNGCKKIVSITKCNEKNCLKHITLQVPKMVTPNKKIMVCPLQVYILHSLENISNFNIWKL